MLTQEQVAQFQRDGYLNGGKVIGDEEVEVLRDELKRVIENKDSLDRKPVMMTNLSGNDDAPVWQIVNIWQASEPFRVLMNNAKITEEIAQLTNADVLRIWPDQIQYKPAEVGGVNWWHQDAPLWPIIRPMTEVSAWVALDDVDESNGCMSMVPGSQGWGNNIDFLGSVYSKDGFDVLPAEFEGHEVKMVRCPVKKGEVHYHHALTWHGSHANTSGRPRRAIAFHYMTGDTRYVASGGHPMKPYVTVGDGEILKGDVFPTVYARSGAD
jgi:ectoine hydroxylase-related dioxygenase (phytanoyl-CoA dioxygenase family)